MKIESLEKLMIDQLKDLYSAENQLLKALPKMVKAASSEMLKEAITVHIEETQNQVERLNEIAKILGIKLTGKKCAAMEGLIEEAKEVLEADGPESVIDLALVACAQRVEHYEISGYGTCRTIAEHLGQTEIAELLQATLDEESAADEKLTAISIDDILPGAETEDEDSMEESDEDSEEAPRR